ncbi:MAG: PASTA domain-containing protein [Gemmatimonadota bacterium]|nr:PASTA domain-containing protein [Gemmatimonadota bacterium]
MTKRAWWRRAWPFAAAAAGGFALAWIVIGVFVFPPGAPPADGTVPNVIGLSFDAAATRLQQDGFKAQRGEMRFQQSVPKMSVIGMTPVQGTRQPMGTAVVLDLSAGPQMGVVPNVVGMQRSQADSALAAAGFTSNPDTVTQASDQPVGTVIASQPAGGAGAAVPSVVQLVLSAGPATIAVPDLTGRTIVEARVLLEQLGLALGDVTILNSGGAGDQASVVQQNPAAGTLVPLGARVTVSVSGGSTP